MIKKRGNILIILAIVAALAAAAIYVRFNPFSLPTYPPKPSPTITSQPTPTSGQTKTFQSKNMKLSIQVSADFDIEEKFTTVNISNLEGKILISRNSTNFSNLGDYIKDLIEKNKVEIADRMSLTINGYDAISGFMGTQKIYLIYVNDRVYSLSTSSRLLYDELDQIAQSFLYIP